MVGIVGKAVVVLLAILGVFVLSLWVMTWFQIIGACQEQVLARAISPSGGLAAEHYRKRCENDRPDEYFFKVGTPWSGSGASYTEVALRADAVRQANDVLTMKPLRIWWTSDNTLHIETPPHDSVKVPSELGGVRIIVQPYQ